MCIADYNDATNEFLILDSEDGTFIGGRNHNLVKYGSPEHKKNDYIAEGGKYGHYRWAEINNSTGSIADTTTVVKDISDSANYNFEILYIE